MDAFAKSMDKYFIPVKLGSDSIKRKKGGADTLMQDTPDADDVIQLFTTFLILSLIDVGITNVVSNAFIAKSDTDPHTGIATRGAENHGAIASFCFSALVFNKRCIKHKNQSNNHFLHRHHQCSRLR